MSKMSAIFESSMPLLNRCVDDALFHAASNIEHALLQNTELLLKPNNVNEFLKITKLKVKPSQTETAASLKQNYHYV